MPFLARKYKYLKYRVSDILIQNWNETFLCHVLCCDTDFRVCCLLLCISVLPGIPLFVDNNMKEIGKWSNFLFYFEEGWVISEVNFWCLHRAQIIMGVEQREESLCLCRKLHLLYTLSDDRDFHTSITRNSTVLNFKQLLLLFSLLLV